MDLYNNKELIEEIDIKESVIDKILNSKDKYIEPGQGDIGITALLKNEDMSFEIKGGNFDILLVIKDLSIPNPEWSQELKIENNDDRFLLLDKGISSISSQGYLLIKEKTNQEAQ